MKKLIIVFVLITIVLFSSGCDFESYKSSSVNMELDAELNGTHQDFINKCDVLCSNSNFRIYDDGESGNKLKIYNNKIICSCYGE